jgi:hypothetical protein
MVPDYVITSHNALLNPRYVHHHPLQIASILTFQYLTVSRCYIEYKSCIQVLKYRQGTEVYYQTISGVGLLLMSTTPQYINTWPRGTSLH